MGCPLLDKEVSSTDQMQPAFVTPRDFIRNPFLGQLSKRVSYLCKVLDELLKVRKQTYHFSHLLIIYPTNLTCGKAKLHLVRFNVILNLLISDKLF